MSVKTIRQLDEEAKGLLLAAKTLYDKGDDATPEEMEDAATKTASAEEIVARLDRLKGDESLKTINRIENTLATLNRPNRPGFGGDGADDPGPGPPRRGGSPASRHGHAAKSIGEMFAEDPAITAWREMVAPGGRVPESIPGPSPSLAIKTLITSAIDSTADRPLLGQADRRPEIARLGWPELVLRQMVTTLTTNTDLVEHTRELARTNNAAGVAEATSDSGSSGEKPQSALTWEVVPVPVETVAHWIPATTRVLADSRRLRAEIDAFLYAGLDDAVEAALLTGNGSSPNFQGINNTSGILTQAYDAGTDQGPGLLVTTRKAKTKAKVTGKARPTAYLFHPNDAEDLDLLTDAEDRYYFNGPAQDSVPMLWGLPRMESEHQTEGLGLLADWRQAVIYDREQATVRIGTIDRFFVRNLIAMLAELRMAFGLRRPRSFVQIDLTA